MRGRKPVPTVLKLLAGNPGKRKLNAEEPHPEALAPDCPEEIAEDADARREWVRVIAPAIARGQITAADRAAAIAHCDLWATWRSQLVAAARHAHVVAVGKHGYPTPNPARGMANKTLLMLMKVDAELGLTPASRSRVKASGAGRRQSALEAFRKTGSMP